MPLLKDRFAVMCSLAQSGLKSCQKMVGTEFSENSISNNKSQGLFSSLVSDMLLYDA